jgi:hypothetical protein
VPLFHFGQTRGVKHEIPIRFAVKTLGVGRLDRLANFLTLGFGQQLEPNPFPFVLAARRRRFAELVEPYLAGRFTGQVSARFFGFLPLPFSLEVFGPAFRGGIVPTSSLAVKAEDLWSVQHLQQKTLAIPDTRPRSIVDALMQKFQCHGRELRVEGFGQVRGNAFLLQVGQEPTFEIRIRSSSLPIPAAAISSLLILCNDSGTILPL